MRLNILFIFLFFTLITSNTIAQKTISGKNEKLFSLNLQKFIQEFDEAHPAALADNILSYEKYLKVLDKNIKDPTNKIYKKAKEISSEDFEAYQIGSLAEIKIKFLEEGLKFSKMNNFYLEEEKQYENGLLRRGKVHFTIEGRKISIKVSYLRSKRKFYLLALNKVNVQYKKVYVEPITFVSNFWDSLPPQFPKDRVFFYPKMNSLDVPERNDNIIMSGSNSAEIDSILHRSKNIENSAIYEMINSNRDTIVTYKLYFFHEKDTLYAASVNYVLSNYLMEDNSVWIPTKLTYQELANDSVHYQVSSIPKCQMRGSYLYFDLALIIRFGRYSNEIRVHNGATTYTELNIRFSTDSGKLIVEEEKGERSDFSRKIIKSTFQVEEEVIFQIVNSKEEVIE